MLPKWTVTYVRNKKRNEQKEVDVFAETVFEAWYNGMVIIGIKEKTEEFTIKGVNPKKTV